ncbi:MAG: hypothetical protein ACR2IF_05050 [Terriglobales bacterium]
MAENTAPSPGATDPAAGAPAPEPKPRLVPKRSEEDFDRAHVPMEEEFSRARWTLPPWQPVAVALVIVAVVVAILAYTTRAKPQGAASMDNINAVQVQPDSVLVAVNVALSNNGEKPLWVHTIKATLTTEKGIFNDEAAPAVDVERYYQAFPDLKQNTQAPLLPEAKVAPGAQQKGTVVFSFNVTKDDFDKRKSLTVTIQPYDQKAVVLTK